VLLVDNGSQPADYEKLTNAFGGNPCVELLRIERNCGYVGGVNHGLTRASQLNPGYYLVMNNDTIIDPLAVTHLVEAAQRHGNRAIVSGKVYYFDHPNTLQHTGVVFTNPRYCTTSYPGRNQPDEGQFDQELERDSLDDVFWIIPADVFSQVGLYSHHFFLYAEQGDYAQRARRLGFKLIYTPHAKLWHKESMTIGGGNPKALHIQYWRGKGSFIFFFRNLKFRYFVAIATRQVTKHLYKALLGKPQLRPYSRARLRGYWAGFVWLFTRKPDRGYNPYLIKK
jgi:hypothetical protein